MNEMGMVEIATEDKTCTKCYNAYPATAEYFYRSRTLKSGLFAKCKKCGADYQRCYRMTEKGRQNARNGCKRYHSTIVGYLRNTYSGMKTRCNNFENKRYKDYGGRGIKLNFSSDNFVDYVINKLQIDPRGLTIDRIDNNGHYEPGNIRFITAKENCNNRGRL
ncbi:hypothetical protein LCGC14_2755180 [marine sediment metagenome]|uniref:Uncharacterized protein n=1 Tax=marine sediment metagenome TaxID=412755 RepID=A0A0F8Z0G6_9ZZZZ